MDLQLALNNSRIVPTQATDLHLNQIYGTESVRLPVTVQNLGTDPAKGNVTVEVFLSTTADLGGSVSGTTPIKSLPFTVNLASSASVVQSVDVTIDSATSARLTPGTKYYFVLRLSSETINESDDNNGADQNNIVASDTAYDFVGVPATHANVFPAAYFRVVRNALGSVDPFAHVGAPYPVDGRHFTAAFESPGGYDHPNLGAYLDSKGIPTIGIGLNLNALDPSVRTALAADVRSFYAAKAANAVAGYSSIDSLKDNQVINMLKGQAQAAGSGGQGQDALTVADAQVLFDTVYAKHQQAVIDEMGQGAWDLLAPNIQWVLTDVHFNIGTNFSRVLDDLQAPGGIDFARVGFDFLDNKRTVDVGIWRSLAGFEFLVQGHEQELGRVV